MSVTRLLKILLSNVTKIFDVILLMLFSIILLRFQFIVYQGLIDF